MGGVRASVGAGSRRPVSKDYVWQSLFHCFFVGKLFIPPSEVFAASSLVGPHKAVHRLGSMPCLEQWESRAGKQSRCCWAVVPQGCCRVLSGFLSALWHREENAAACFLHRSPSFLPWEGRSVSFLSRNAAEVSGQRAGQPQAARVSSPWLYAL